MAARDDVKILESKLTVPAVRDIVTRERLLTELERSRDARASVIVAGAGYGKSVLGSQYLRRMGSPCIWYQLDETDADLAVLLAYLIEGLRRFDPEFGRRTRAVISETKNVMERRKSIFGTFITELDDLMDDELYIALDDFHTINESPYALEAVAFLLDHMLPNIHLLIISRNQPNLDLTRLRASRQLVEMEEADLSFTTGETMSLFSDVLGMPLDSSEAAAIREHTEGWVAGLVLFYLALKGSGREGVASALQDLGGPPKAVADYLSKAVYETQKPEVQDFLLATSILSRMNPTFCEELSEVAGSREFLPMLGRERLFTYEAEPSGDWYRYHACLKSFLSGILSRTYSPTRIRTLHHRAAELWQVRGELEEALSHYLAAGSFSDAAEILEEIDGDLMRANRLTFLHRELGRLPHDIFREHPRLLMRRGQVAALMCDYDQVVAGHSDVANTFHQQGKDDRQARALMGLATAFIAMGRAEDALKNIIKAREAMPLESPFYIEMTVIESVIYIGIGQDEPSETLCREAWSRVHEIASRKQKARVCDWCGISFYLQGKFHQAIEALEATESLMAEEGLAAFLPFHYGILSRSYAFLDRLDEGENAAVKGMAKGEELGLMSMACFSQAARAISRAYRGEIEEAAEDASVAASTLTRYESGAEIFIAEFFVGKARGLTGDIAGALDHMEKYQRRVGSFSGYQRIADTGLQGFSFKKLVREIAEKKSEQLLKSARQTGGLALSLSYSMTLTEKLLSQKLDDAESLFEEYFERFGEDIILRSYRTDASYWLPLMTRFFDRGEHLELMERTFTITGVQSRSYLSNLRNSPEPFIAEKATRISELVNARFTEPLTVKMLGGFQMSRGEEEIPSSNWKSKKALTALKYLVLMRDTGGVSREMLIEMLWPEVPSEAAGKSLNAALTAIRKMLEPDASRGESDYLEVRGEMLQVNYGPGGWSDVEVFRNKLRQARRAKEMGEFDTYLGSLKDASKVYGGDFLREEPSVSLWTAEREALRNEFVQLMLDLATEHQRRGEAEEAIESLEHGLKYDPGREELYRKKMSVCSRQGDISEIERTFRRCRDYLKDSYGVAPSRKTEELYSRLVLQGVPC